MAVPSEVANAWLKLNILQEENFQMNLNFAISLMAKTLNFTVVYFFVIFKNLSMIAYILNIQKSIFFYKSVLNSVNLTILGTVTIFNSVYNINL